MASFRVRPKIWAFVDRPKARSTNTCVGDYTSISFFTGSILALVLLTDVNAAAAAGTHLNSIWLVESSPARTEAFWLKPKEMLAKARLLPPALAVIQEKLDDPEYPDQPIAAGTQLFGVMDGSIWNPKPAPFPIFCEVNGFAGKEAFLASSKPIVRRCFVDRENDGVLDGLFSIATCNASFPVLANADLPKKLTTISVRYAQQSPTSISDGPQVGIVFDGFNYMNGGPRFLRVFGDGSLLPAQGRQSQRKTEDGEQELFGARFTVNNIEKDRVQVRLNSPIPPQVFAMVSSGNSC